MDVQALLAGLVHTPVPAGVRVCGLDLDSRRVGPGEAFVALRGLAHHGIEFADAARARGAAVVLAEAPPPPGREDAGAVWVDDLGQQLGALAARFYGQPAANLRVTGVTGTNGKTSVVQFLQQAWAALGRPVASIGTLGAGLAGAITAGERTTPDAIRMQALLARFRDAGAREVVMEVSSHALVQGRVNAVPFALAVFTNLSRDHLDYHGSMQAYGQAKARLFAWPGLQAAIINADDALGQRLLAELGAGVRGLSFAVESKQADVRASRVASHGDGLDFVLHTPWGEAPVRSPLLGRFNVANLLAVAACLGVCGVPFARIPGLLAGLQPVDGRMNRIGGGAQPLVVVDYAHTPQALELALQSLRAHCAGKLVCVFGAGGDRDAGKRPLMGAVAERLADRIVITDDNPRSEDGDAIAAAIAGGLAAPQRARIVRDRALAIAEAIAACGPGDVVLVAGKGHERSQTDAHGSRPFNDLEVAAKVLAGEAPC